MAMLYNPLINIIKQSNIKLVASHYITLTFYLNVCFINV